MSKMFIGCMTKLKTVNSIFKMERPSVASENVCFLIGNFIITSLLSVGKETSMY